MATREEMIAFLSNKQQEAANPKTTPSREEMISFIQQKQAEPQAKPQETEQAAGYDWNPLNVNPKNFGAGFIEGLKKYDEYINAPIRKFVTEKATGETLEKAPTGAEQAKRMGATDVTYGEYFGIPEKVRPYVGGNISPADIYGVGLEIVQDPLVIASGIKKGFQVAGESVGKVADQLFNKTTNKAIQSQTAQGLAESTAKGTATAGGGSTTVEQSIQPFSVNAPKSLKELEDWAPQPGQGVLVGKQRLKEIESALPDLQTKPLKYHSEMFDNPKSMKALKLQFENLPTKNAQKIAAYNQEIVDESFRKIGSTVEQYSGGQPRSLSDAGYDLIESVKTKYNSDKEMLGPLFKEIQDNAKAIDPVASRDLTLAIGENSKLGKTMTVDKETGRITLARNAPRTGISDQEHGILSRVVEDLNDGMTFKEIQDTRDFLRKSVDPANPAATAEINKVRSILLDQLENMSSKYGDKVHSVFKAYAVNERARESIEKIIGGKIESLDAMFAANPDKVVKKIFSNPNYTKVVGSYVGPQKMNEVIGSFINSGFAKSVDSVNGFKPHEFRNWLKANDSILKANISPEALIRLNALADYGYMGKRFLDEVNPSGSGASILKGLSPGEIAQKVATQNPIATATNEVASRVGLNFKQRQAMRNVNEMMGTPKKTIVTNSLKTAIKDTSRNGKILDAAALTSARVKMLGNSTSEMRGVGENKDKPTKGPEKWMNDGLKKLEAHEGPIPDEAKAELLKSQKGQQLLFRASDLQPGTKAMSNLALQIKKFKGE
jgi:hypothetical protein